MPNAQPIEADATITVTLRVRDPECTDRLKAAQDIHDWLCERLPPEWVDHAEVDVTVLDPPLILTLVK